MREGEKIVVTDGEVNTFYPSLSPPSPLSLSLCKCTHVNISYIIYITSLSLSSLVRYREDVCIYGEWALFPGRRHRERSGE